MKSANNLPVSSWHRIFAPFIDPSAPACRTLGLLFFAAIFLAGSACSTIRLRYTAKSTNSDGSGQILAVEKSYPIGGALKPLCYITAIGFGGSCWFYLAMPTTEQRQIFREDAQNFLRQKLANPNFEPKSVLIERVSWEEAETSFTTETVKF